MRIHWFEFPDEDGAIEQVAAWGYTPIGIDFVDDGSVLIPALRF